jgi:hypothetical protein
LWVQEGLKIEELIQVHQRNKELMVIIHHLVRLFAVAVVLVAEVNPQATVLLDQVVVVQEQVVVVQQVALRVRA